MKSHTKKKLKQFNEIKLWYNPKNKNDWNSHFIGENLLYETIKQNIKRTKRRIRSMKWFNENKGTFV